MDSSSDGSFAWTDASSDTIDSTIMLNDKVNRTHSDDESVSGKSYKKKLQDALFAKNNGDAVEEPPHRPKERKRKRTERQSSPEQASPKKKKIKMEPESDIDVSTNKHKTNGHNISESYDESYLDLKVKAEEQFTSPTVSKTKKNKCKISTNAVCNDESSETKSKDRSCNESDIEDHKLDLLVQQEMDQHEKKIKKKKKKSKKKGDSEMYNDFNNSDSQLEKDAINVSSGSPLVYAEEPQVDLIKNSIQLKNNNPNDSRDENEARGLQQDLSIVKSAFNRRISERIQFEEDESSDMETSQLQSSKTSTKSSKLKSFLKDNVNLKPYTRQIPSESALTVDDEIWIVRCPKEVDIDAFKNKDLELEGKCKLKLNSQTYEGVVDKESRIMSILSSEQSNFVIKSLPVKGCLNLRKRIPKAHIQDEALISNQLNFIPLPETKCRHPLFGANYRKAIKLPTKVSARLQPPCPASSPASYKKRSRHDKNSYQPNSDYLLSSPKAEPISEESAVPEMETDQPVSSKKKKKKRKHSESKEISPKKKRIKHDLESAEAWESEQAIEENLFNF